MGFMRRHDVIMVVLPALAASPDEGKVPLLQKWPFCAKVGRLTDDGVNVDDRKHKKRRYCTVKGAPVHHVALRDWQAMLTMD